MFDFLGGFDFDPDDGMDTPDDPGNAALGAAIGDEVPDMASGEMTADGGTAFDLDGDGIADGVQFTGMTDLDGDGMEETIIQQTWLDADGDGILDTMVNTIGSDTDRDGSLDTTQMTMFTDTDGDGEFETVTNAVDLDGDGSLDVTDTNPFGAEDETDDTDVDVTDETDVDPTDDSELDPEEDVNPDDFPGEDEDDIEPADDMDDLSDDEVAEDSELDYGDAIPDAAEGETTEDGGTAVDLDGDGVTDAVVYVTEEDTTGDGVADTVVEEYRADLDGDGEVDTVAQVVYKDTDGDGVADTSYENQYRDTDGDGKVDVAYHWDEDGNMTAAAASEVYEQFDAEETDLDSVVGDPETAMDSWHVQESVDTCAVASQEFVLEQLTGEEYDEADLVDIAEENGWYTEGGGTTMDDVGNILEYMGLDVERSSGNDISDIEECLENGGAVIVAVDSGELWSGENEENYGPGGDADHAVQVIGIDYSDPDNPMVILNDSGVADGCGAMVPLDDFMDAWEDSGCYMVEAYA